ncbi:unannotated protein [freshwater metagenome]|uniref:Unannotated protein n=1 Tax=freshwater metagenome TaxID=449393 RepID=A0A6J6MMW3_9ZZZZ
MINRIRVADHEFTVATRRWCQHFVVVEDQVNIFTATIQDNKLEREFNSGGTVFTNVDPVDAVTSGATKRGVARCTKWAIGDGGRGPIVGIDVGKQREDKRANSCAQINGAPVAEPSAAVIEADTTIVVDVNSAI